MIPTKFKGKRCALYSTVFWPSLSTRRKYLSLTMIYDLLHNHVSLQFSDYFTFSSASTRSHSLSLLCKQSSLNSYLYSIFVNSIFRWISIPFEILSITRQTTFRRLLYNSLSLVYIYLFLCVVFVFFLLFFCDIL